MPLLPPSNVVDANTFTSNTDSVENNDQEPAGNKQSSNSITTPKTSSTNVGSANLTPFIAPDMLSWTRLPTPIPHELFSPPSSGTSSPRALSICTSSTSTAYSHPSHPSDTHNLGLPSPLPSPKDASASTSAADGADGGAASSALASTADTDAPTPAGTSSKTAAFFGSPFASTGPTTPAPPPPPSRSLTISTERPTTKSSDDSSSSATANFFSFNSNSLRPTPPPSIKSKSSASSVDGDHDINGNSSPPRRSQSLRLPPLSRFFPSRYGAERRREAEVDAETEPDRDGDEYGNHPRRRHHEVSHIDYAYGNGRRSRESDDGWETTFKREFIQLTEAQLQANGVASGSAAGPSGGGEAYGLAAMSPAGSPVRERKELCADKNTDDPGVDRQHRRFVDLNDEVGPEHECHPGHDEHHHCHHHSHLSHPHPHSHVHFQAHPIKREKHHVPPPHVLDAPSFSNANARHGLGLGLAISSQPSTSSTDSEVHTSPISVEAPSEESIERRRHQDGAQHKDLESETPSLSTQSQMFVANTVEQDENYPYVAGSVLRSGEAGVDVRSGSGATSAISSKPAVELALVRKLGEGAFSSVWLAEDVNGILSGGGGGSHLSGGNYSDEATGEVPPLLHVRRKSESWAKKGSDKKLMKGIKPAGAPVLESSMSTNESVLLGELDGEGASDVVKSTSKDSQATGARDGQDHEQTNSDRLGPSASTTPSLSAYRSFNSNDKTEKGRIIAVKMMNRALCDANDRTRISFVREVEVLRHISHPSIVSYLHSFTTQTHHCLVLEYVTGGELFDLVNSDAQYAKVTEPAVRRMWGELAKAVGWMHGVGLVHRDIKLENILLTTNIFDVPTDQPARPLPSPRTPLIKLTDFGLSRFIDPAAPLLSTRCGSESYAAPELVLGASRSNSASASIRNGLASSAASTQVGYYDGRQTDAWACGVVLYALATRALPFDFNTRDKGTHSGGTSRSGSVAGSAFSGSTHGHAGSAYEAAMRRREMLMRIVHCDYSWPDEDESSSSSSSSSDSEGDAAESATPSISSSSFSSKQRRQSLASRGLKQVVSRLLIRDVSNRARLVDLWDEPWMRGEGAPAPPAKTMRRRIVSGTSSKGSVFQGVNMHGDVNNASSVGVNESQDALANGTEEIRDGDPHIEEESCLGTECEDEGVLVDGEHIDSIALQDMEPN